MVNKCKLNNKLKQKAKDMFDKDTIETFLLKAEEHIQDRDLKGAMTYLVALVAKYPTNDKVLLLKQKYEDTNAYKSSKKFYERIHDVKV